MAEIEIRPVVARDIPTVVQLDHGVETAHTWQMTHLFEDGQIQVNFQRIRLPRSFRLEYPRSPAAISNTWKKFNLFLVATLQTKCCGYLTLENKENLSGTLVDLVVDEPQRRQGIATAMLLSAQDWLKANGIYRIIVEVPIKNEAAIALAEKMGFVYCGFMDGFFGNRDIAFYYSLTLR